MSALDLGHQLRQLRWSAEQLALRAKEIEDSMSQSRGELSLLDERLRLIVNLVAHHHQIEPSALLGRRRWAAVVLARHTAIYILADLTDLSHRTIAQALGGRTHASVAHAIDRINDRIETEPAFEQQLEQLRFAASSALAAMPHAS